MYFFFFIKIFKNILEFIRYLVILFYLNSIFFIKIIRDLYQKCNKINYYLVLILILFLKNKILIFNYLNLKKKNIIINFIFMFF